MSGYTKLFESILDSSVWDLDDQTVRVWIALMALADKDGIVSNTIPGLARRAKVSIEVCKQALVVFMSPDEYSRTKANEGRRIEEVEEGWRLLNHAKYRRLLCAEDQRVKGAIRQQKYWDSLSPEERRQRHKNHQESSGAVRSNGSDDKQKQIQKADTDPKADPISNPPTPQGGSVGSDETPEPTSSDKPDRVKPELVRKVFEFWQKEFSHPNAKFDRKRATRIQQRLREGFTVRELCFAIHGAKKDDFLMGKNDRHQVYDDIGTLLRDAAQVEKLMAHVGQQRGVRVLDPAREAAAQRTERAIQAQRDAAIAKLNADARKAAIERGEDPDAPAPAPEDVKRAVGLQ